MTVFSTANTFFILSNSLDHCEYFIWRLRRYEHRSLHRRTVFSTANTFFILSYSTSAGLMFYFYKEIFLSICKCWHQDQKKFFLLLCNLVHTFSSSFKRLTSFTNLNICHIFRLLQKDFLSRVYMTVIDVERIVHCKCRSNEHFLCYVCI